MNNSPMRFGGAANALPELPFVREFFNTMILCFLVVFMTLGAGMWVVMVLEAGAKSLLGLLDPALRQFLFEAHPNGLWAWEQLLGHGLDLAIAIGMLIGITEINPHSLSWLDLSRGRFQVIRVLALVAVAYAIYRGANYLVFDIWQVGAGQSAGPQVSRAMQLTAIERIPMLMNTLIIAPVLEELLFRGYVYNLLRTSLRHAWAKRLFLAEVAALLMSAGLFTILHAAGANSQGLLQIMIAAVILTLLYRWTGILAAPIALHFVLNGMTWYNLLVS